MKSLDKPFAAGRTAEIFAWEDGLILKLYRDWCPRSWVEHEAFIARAVNQAGVPSPVAGEIIEVNGRRGILYERVDGPDMLEAMKRNLRKLPVYARWLAELHVTMHHSPAPDLPSQHREFAGAIGHAKGLPDDLRQKTLERLAALPEGDRLCHGDFHPGNVLITRRGPLVIDWMTAVRGSPAADVARTRLLLTIGDPPQGGLLRLLLLFGRGVFYRTYLRTYERLSPGVIARSEAYLPILAAARLNEEIRGEENRLLELVRG